MPSKLKSNSVLFQRGTGPIVQTTSASPSQSCTEPENVASAASVVAI